MNEKLALGEKALREIHEEYVKQKGRTDRLQELLRAKDMGDYAHLQDRVHELEYALASAKTTIMALERERDALKTTLGQRTVSSAKKATLVKPEVSFAKNAITPAIRVTKVSISPD